MSFFDKLSAVIPKDNGEAPVLKPEWKQDRLITLDAEPDTLEELKAAVDVSDPGRVAAYWVYAVSGLPVDYDTAMSMMKYLFADIEPFGRGYTEGGGVGRAGWDPYFNERLTDEKYRWLPRAFFYGATRENGFNPPRPVKVQLTYDRTNTETANSQSLEQLGRLNIIYSIKSNAAGNTVNITLSRFAGSDRWYVTSGSSSMTMFYGQTV